MKERFPVVKTKKRLFSLRYTVVLLCCFLAALNVGGRHYYCVFAAFGLLLALGCCTIPKNGQTLCLLVLALSLMIFSPAAHDRLTSVLKPFTYLLSYITGYSVIRGRGAGETMERTEAAVSRGILVAAAGPFLHMMLNYAANYGSSIRNTVDIWSGAVLSATGQAALGCLPVGVACGVLFSDRKAAGKLPAVGVLALILGYDLILAGRTLVALVLAVLLLAGVFTLIAAPCGRGRKRIFAFVLAVCVILLALYLNNGFGVRDMVEQSNLYDRFFGGAAVEPLSGGRWGGKLLYLGKFFEHPLGGSHIYHETGRYAHDLLLDTYDEAGIFALLAIAAFVVKSAANLWAVLRSSTCSFAFQQMVLCTYGACYIQFAVEPVLAGVPWLLALFCFIDGMVTGVLAQTPRPAPSMEE